MTKTLLVSMTIFSISAITCLSKSADRTNLIRHAEAGHDLDKVYYDTGTKIDIAHFDLKEAIRQGRTVPEKVLKQVRSAEQQLRNQWLQLETMRKQLYKQLYLPAPKESYLLCIENMNNAPSDYTGWVAFRSLQLKWANDHIINLPLHSFLKCSFKKKYSYNCSPSDTIIIRGKMSDKHTAVTTLNPKELPSGDAELILSGLDCDKPGLPIEMKVYIYGNEVYNGPNPFKKNGWSQFKIKIPASKFRQRKITTSKQNTTRLFIKLEHGIKHFAKTATAMSNTIEKLTTPYRNKLKYKYRPFDISTFNKTFQYGIDVSNTTYGLERFKYPGNYMNMEYVGKALHDAGFNVATFLVSNKAYPEKCKLLTEQFDSHCGIPWFIWAAGPEFTGGDIINNSYYGNIEKMLSDTTRFWDQYKDLTFLAGIQVDEPIIVDNPQHRGTGGVLNNQKVLALYSTFLTKRKPELERNGINLTSLLPFHTKPTSENEMALWMEWQYFKKALYGEHHKHLYNATMDNGYYTSIVQMNKNPNKPQLCSYVSMGQNVPCVASDLYLNGSIGESFAIQLLKNAAIGKTVMWPAGGYNSKSPETFQRTLAISTAFADGFHIWEYAYCSKYRDANYFWRFAGKRDNNDDNGRSLLNDWNPEFWDIVKKTIQDLKAGQHYLMDRSSQASVAVAVSERTIISLEPSGKTINYWQNSLGLYADLSASGLVVDSIFVENLTPAKLQQYKVIVLCGAATLTLEETTNLETWVKQGGCLITSGKTAMHDQWGRALSKDQLPAIASLKSKKLAAGQIFHFPGENIGLSKYRLPGTGLPGKRTRTMEKLCKQVKQYQGKQIAELVNPPYGLGISIQKKGRAYIINLIDWYNKRTASDIQIKINKPGNWTVYNPASNKKLHVNKSIFTIEKFNIWKMLILKPGV